MIHRGHDYKGVFITFEGIDFCGKSTQIDLLHEYLDKNHKRHIIAREPGGTDIGEKNRDILLDPANFEMFVETEAYQFAASRAQLVREILIPNLGLGIHVIVDRFLDSSKAYQSFGRKLGLHKVDEINRVAVNGIVPDITFLVDISIDEWKKRKMKKKDGLDRIESSNIEFYERVIDGYRYLAEQEPDRIKVLKGERPEETIHQEIIMYVKKYL